MKYNVYATDRDNQILEMMLNMAEKNGWKFEIDEAARSVKLRLHVRLNVNAEKSIFLGSDVSDFCLFIIAAGENFFPPYEADKWIEHCNNGLFMADKNVRGIVVNAMIQFRSLLQELGIRLQEFYDLLRAFEGYCKDEDFPIEYRPSYPRLGILATTDEDGDTLELEYDYMSRIWIATIKYDEYVVNSESFTEATEHIQSCSFDDFFYDVNSFARENALLRG